MGEVEQIDYDQYLGVDPNLPQFMKEPLIKEAEAKLKKEQRRGAKTTTPSASRGKRKYRKNANGILEEVSSDEDLSKTAQTATPFPIPGGQRKYRKNPQTGKMEEIPPNEEL